MTTDPIGLSIEMFPAGCGDSFLLTANSAGRQANILVDAGLPSTYREQLAESGAALDALVVTHVDDDHIGGAIDLISENGEHEHPNVIRISDVWHNSYRHLGLDGRPPSPEELARVSAVSRSTAGGSGPISARQGSTLAGLLTRFHYPWNAAFNGSAIVVRDVPPVVTLGEFQITVLSPMTQTLAALAKLWRRELLSLGVPHDVVGAAEFEAAFERTFVVSDEEGEVDEISASDLTEPPAPSTFAEDRSITNASSIALLVEAAGRSALFLGDSVPSVVEKQLAVVSGKEKRTVNVVKLSHHGSRRNTSPTLLSLFSTSHCLVSTDGTKHGHPDMEALLWLVASQPGVKLHFNYETRGSASVSRAPLLAKYGYSVHVANGKPYTLQL